MMAFAFPLVSSSGDQRSYRNFVCTPFITPVLSPT